MRLLSCLLILFVSAGCRAQQPLLSEAYALAHAGYTASVLRQQPAPGTIAAMYRHRADICKRYKKRRAGGIVLCCIAGAALGSGIYLVARGVQVNNEGPAFAGDGTGGIVGGGMLMFIGAGCLGGGLTLAIISSRKIHRKCNSIKSGNSVRANIELLLPGNRLALNF
jgi:uncharacterized membrane protein YedE/YeeE